MDEEFCQQLARLLDTKVLHNSHYLSHDIQAVMRRCALFMGMRFHSLILAVATETPVVGLVYAPKVRGFMKLLGCEAYSLELAELQAENLETLISTAWLSRAELRRQQIPVVNELKAGATQAAKQFKDCFFP